MKKRLQMTAAILVAAMLLGGCGEPLYDLTEKEEKVIVNYSAHIVTKYNSFQGEGLTYVWSEEKEEEPDQEVQAEVVAAEEETGSAEEQQQAAPVLPDASDATLGELFGENGLELRYVGARLSDNYAENEYYVLDPRAGMHYLVIGIDITNNGAAPVVLDYLAMAPQFYVTVNGVENASSELTLLNEDFSSFEGSLSVGQTKETVLLFQVPDSLSELQKVELYVALNSTNYQIIL